LYQMLVFSFYINALRSFLYAIVPTAHWAIGIELLQGMSWALLWVCCIEYVNEVVPNQWRATGQSLLWSVFLGAGTIIGNVWTGYLYGHMSLRKVYLYNSAGILVFSILVTFYIVHFVRKSRSNSIQN